VERNYLRPSVSVPPVHHFTAIWLVTDQPSQDGHANLHDSEIVCLEIGEACTGHLLAVLA